MSKAKAPPASSVSLLDYGMETRSAKSIEEKSSSRADKRDRVGVAVLVDLVRHPGAGGHVKAWERFADAARNLPDELDMTVYFLGDGITETVLAENVRIRTVPPAFGTASIPWLRNGGGDTDLASYNPHLARQLLQHDVFHATSAFAFAKTARTVARLHGRPLVSSVHTSAGKFAKIYTGEIIERLIGHGMLSKLLIDTIGIPDMSARNLDRARDRVLSASDHILVSNAEDEGHVRNVLAGCDRFHFFGEVLTRACLRQPSEIAHGLRRTYGVPEDRPVVLFAGRVDESKRVMTAAKAARALIDQGERSPSDDCRRRLGRNAHRGPARRTRYLDRQSESERACTIDGQCRPLRLSIGKRCHRERRDRSQSLRSSSHRHPRGDDQSADFSAGTGRLASEQRFDQRVCRCDQNADAG